MDKAYFYTNFFKIVFAIMCWPIGYVVLCFFLGETYYEEVNSSYICNLIEISEIEDEVERQLKSNNLKKKNGVIFENLVKKLKTEYLIFDIIIKHDKFSNTIHMLQQTPLQKTTISIIYEKDAEGVLDLNIVTPSMNRRYHWLLTPYLYLNSSLYKKFEKDYEDLSYKLVNISPF